MEILKSPFDPQASLETTLNRIFPLDTEETKYASAKGKLGETAKIFTDEQVKIMVTDFQYLIEIWLDEFEKEVFSGKTLKELLGGKEYADCKQK